MKSNLYTGTGDAGTTSLVGGQRVSKTCLRLESYGTIDELSSFLGVVAASVDCTGCIRSQIRSIQNSLFDVGCYLATQAEEGSEPKCEGVDEGLISEIETWIDRLDADTPAVRAFVLPGGCQAASHCHVARTVCRRAERIILSLAEREYVDPLLLRWTNRLSDYLFIAARHLNHVAGVGEITWKKKYDHRRRPASASDNS